MGRETKLFTELNCTLEIVDVAASANGRKRENRPSLFARAENIDERVHRTEFRTDRPEISQKQVGLIESRLFIREPFLVSYLISWARIWIGELGTCFTS